MLKLKKLNKTLQPYLSNSRRYLDNVWIRGAVVLVAMAVSEFIWARYISNISDGNALIAASWGSVVIALGAFITLSYVDDKRMILPATIGAFLGTYFAV